jgi:hypothetical protein
VLAKLRVGLEGIGFSVERGKRAVERIRLPVLFGEQGTPRVTYEVDGFHDELGIALAVAAGRAWMGNALYRDLIRASLVVDANYLALGVMNGCRYQSGGRTQINHSYAETKDMLDAVYANGRLQLPFKGLLLFGY